jgi:parallel beta-helix repeat protein
METMMRKMFSEAVLMLLVLGLMAVSLRVQPVGATEGTVHIRADGSIDPSTAPVVTLDNLTYTLTASMPDAIIIERDNIVLDGAGNALQGEGSGNGTDLTGRTNVTVKNMDVEGFAAGVMLFASSGCTILGNNVTGNNQYGIELRISSSNSILGNIVTDNYFGIWFDSSTNTTVSGNTMKSNSFGILLSSSGSNTVSGNSATNNSNFGLVLQDFSGGNTVSGNNITDNGNGILLSSSSDNTVSGNDAADNSGAGVILQATNHTAEPFTPPSSSGSNAVFENSLTSNSYGLLLLSSFDNSVYENNITDNKVDGVSFSETSEGNIVFGNKLENNGYGIEFDNIRSGNNVVYHNNFINSSVAHVLTGGSANVWDDGYPSGGNFWSGYNGTDSFMGASQNETGSDAIGDTPYKIDMNNLDRYPLMGTFGTLDAGTWNGTSYSVDFVSNSTVSDFQILLTQQTLAFNVTGLGSISGFCRVAIPSTIADDLWHGNYHVLLNNRPWPFENWTDATKTYIYVNYNQSEHDIMIVPECLPISTLSWFMFLSTLAVALLVKRKPGKSKIQSSTF